MGAGRKSDSSLVRLKGRGFDVRGYLMPSLVEKKLCAGGRPVVVWQFARGGGARIFVSARRRIASGPFCRI